MRSYIGLCRRGGQAPFQQLVQSAGLISPIDPACLGAVVAKARQRLEI